MSTINEAVGIREETKQVEQVEQVVHTQINESEEGNAFIT